MNAKTIDALKAIRDSIDSIIEFESQTVNSSSDDRAEMAETAPAKKTTRGRVSSSKTSSKKPTPSEDGYTQDQLDSMTYNDLKSLAKSLGIVARGSRDDLTQKILNLGNDDSSDEEPVEEKAPAKTRSSRKLGAKKAEPEPEPEEDDEEEDPVYTSVLAAVEDMSDEEIIEYLHSVGIKAKGKRQSLIAAVVKGVKDGKIELDDSDEEDADDETDSAEVDETEDVEDTAERKKAVTKSNKDIDKQFSKGDITRDDLQEWYSETYDTDPKKVKKMSDEDLLTAYKEVAALFIDDDGELHDNEDPYTIKGTPYCCGTPLKFNEDDNTYICECCGAEYNADEE